jgi:RNA polymerase sigma factor (sigma-70 family)
MNKKNNSTATKQNSPITDEYTRLQIFLKRFLTRFFSSSQDIEDVMQETYLKAYRAEKERVINTPKAFLFRVARNTALKELERKSRQITQSIEDFQGSEVLSDESSVEDQVDARKKLGLFCDSALEMSPQVRRVFLMRKVYGMSYREISAQLGIAVSTAEKHVARGLEVCSTYMQVAEASKTVEKAELELTETVRRLEKGIAKHNSQQRMEG